MTQSLAVKPSHLDPARETGRWAAAVGKALDALVAANPSDDLITVVISTNEDARVFPKVSAISDRSIRQLQKKSARRDLEFDWLYSPLFGFGADLTAELRPAWEADVAASDPDGDLKIYYADTSRRMNVLMGALRLLRERGHLRLRADGGESFVNVISRGSTDEERAVLLNPPGPLLDLYLSRARA